MAVYAPKRIAFDDSYEVRVGIAVGLKNEQEKFMANVNVKMQMYYGKQEWLTQRHAVCLNN